MINNLSGMPGIFLYGLVAVIVAASAAAPAAAQENRPLRVCATVPELGDLARQIGGDEVDVTVFARGTEDPHFIEVRPSFIRASAAADVFIQIGMENEIGWAPLLLRQSRNARIQPGRPGFIDASEVVTEPLEVPRPGATRAMGDVHPSGNPDYILDPINGLHVAALLRDRFSELRPERQSYFEQRYADFRERLGRALIGDELYDIYDFEQLALLHEHGRMRAFLEEQGHLDRLGGWMAAMLPHVSAEVVDDHPIWPYFARRFGIRIGGHLEPQPGLPPTTRHLRDVVRLMNEREIRVILSQPYFDQRHANFVARQTDAVVVPVAHQVGARPNVETYIDMIDHNVREIAAALERTRG